MAGQITTTLEQIYFTANLLSQMKVLKEGHGKITNVRTSYSI
jgi:hypothetical protein